jgi:peptide subunit release factor 1 (eRF1)
MHRQDARDDSEKVERLIGDYRSGGLAVVGVQDVLAALAKGQVEEVLLSTSFSGEQPETILAQARQTGARFRLIEDAPLLAGVGGVGASLRYRD